MERFVKGDVVIVPFPFAEMNAAKRRPAVVVACLEGDDLILCEITSSRVDKYSIQIGINDFAKGKLQVASSARPNRLFTFYNKSIEYKIGRLTDQKTREIIKKIEEILHS